MNARGKTWREISDEEIEAAVNELAADSRYAEKGVPYTVLAEKLKTSANHVWQRINYIGGGLPNVSKKMRKYRDYGQRGSRF